MEDQRECPLVWIIPLVTSRPQHSIFPSTVSKEVLLRILITKTYKGFRNNILTTFKILAHDSSAGGEEALEPASNFSSLQLTRGDAFMCFALLPTPYAKMDKRSSVEQTKPLLLANETLSVYQKYQKLNVTTILAFVISVRSIAATQGMLVVLFGRWTISKEIINNKLV